MWERLILPVLQHTVKSASPEIRHDLVEFLEGLEKRAKATPNPFDDLFVMLVRGILDL